MKTFLISAALCFSLSAFAQENNNNILPTEVQIQTALLPAPEEDRGEATVYGYDDKGELVVLREGTNNLVCLADDPNDEGISVACYSAKLEPFMARGRALRAEGKDVKEIDETREKEANDGTLEMPDAPSMLYVLSGTEENYNPDTGELEDAAFRYVIYTPYATTESTGLPAKPHAPGMPWLMDPGTYKAHIMITPPKDK